MRNIILLILFKNKTKIFREEEFHLISLHLISRINILLLSNINSNNDEDK